MTPTAIDELENIIGNAIVGRKHQNCTVLLRKKILFLIWILAKQESYLAVGDRFELAKSTGHSILKEIVTILIELMPHYIIWPDRNKCNISSSIFERRSRGFPGVIGAIDGCHISCKAPPHNANNFYNRKGSHSIILQGICDHKGRFIHIYVGLPGRMHDVHVFRRSDIYRKLTNREVPLLPSHQHLIGDAAYPLLQNVMTPFRDTGHLTRSQIKYNMKLSCIRSIIEIVFGLLKGKFRRLLFLDFHISDFELGQKMVGAACLLHNFMIDRGEIDYEEDIEIDNQFLIENNINNVYEENNENALAGIKRNNIMHLFA